MELTKKKAPPKAGRAGPERQRRVAVLGIGEENLALLDFLLKEGDKVVVLDQKRKEELPQEVQKELKELPIQCRLGPHYLDHLEDFEIIFRTPGLSFFHPKIQAALKKGVEISSQTKLFFSLCPAKIIGITGTKGKGTTATLIDGILKKTQEKDRREKSKVYLAGNIGTPPLTLLPNLKKEDWVILELSSFQLEDLERSPQIAIILNITSDHLNYHQSQEKYIQAKTSLVAHQGRDDFAVICADYFTCLEFAAMTKAKVWWFSTHKSVDLGCFVAPSKLKRGERDIILRDEKEDNFICHQSQIKLLGSHNLENICAAVTASALAGADINSIREVVIAFQGLPHRLEKVREFQGVEYYNDSYSTNPSATIAAIKSFDRPLILIMGGEGKGLDYTPLSNTIKTSKNIQAVTLMGKIAPELERKLAGISCKVVVTKSLHQAVREANKLAPKGSIVLFSPGAASLDMFTNYKQRGNQFRQEVLKL